MDELIKTFAAPSAPSLDADLELGDDPVDEEPFTAEELLRLARELLPERVAQV